MDSDSDCDSDDSDGDGAATPPVTKARLGAATYKQTCMFDDQQTSLTPKYFPRLRGLHDDHVHVCLQIFN